MIIKKFQAKTEDEALELAKAELGDNVVVLNTKKDVKRKGFLGLFRAKLVEVTVAKEEEQEVNARMEADDLKGAIASVNKIRTQAELGISPESMEKVDDMVSQKLDNIQSLLQERLDKESINKESLDDEVRKVSAPIRKAIEEKDESEEGSEDTGFLKLIYNVMVDNEVNENYANQLISDIEQSFDSEAKMEDILSHIYQKMILKFGKTECISPSTGKGAKDYFSEQINGQMKAGKEYSFVIPDAGNVVSNSMVASPRAIDEKSVDLTIQTYNNSVETGALDGITNGFW